MTMSRKDRNETGVREITAGEAGRFLAFHSPLANADLLSYAAAGAEGIRLLGLFDHSGLAAIAGVRTAPNPVYDHVVWVECPSTSAFRTLLAAAPDGRLYVKTHDDTLADWLETSAGFRPEHRDVYFAVESNQFTPQSPGEERILSWVDVQRFPAARPPAAAVLDAGQSDSIVWGIERSGRIVCSAVGASVARTPDEGIGDLYTEEAWRCRGLAAQLLSAMTGALLTENDHVLYWTTPGNAASQRVVTKLGYVQIHRATEFLMDGSWARQQPH